MVNRSCIYRPMYNGFITVPEYIIVITGRGGGLLYYVMDTLIVNPVVNVVDMNFITSDIESLVISLHLKETLLIYLVGIYRLPNRKRPYQKN